MALCKRSNSVKRLIFLCLLFIPAYVISSIYPSITWAKTRAIRMVVKSDKGTDKIIRLYSGYHALVVGAGDYRKGWPRLPNPVRDAKEVSNVVPGRTKATD